MEINEFKEKQIFSQTREGRIKINKVIKKDIINNKSISNFAEGINSNLKEQLLGLGLSREDIAKMIESLTDKEKRAKLVMSLL